MRRFDIPRNLRKWDRYSEFHITTGPITYFETGELIVTEACPSVDGRYTYSDYNIELAATNDRSAAGGYCVGTLWTQDGMEVPNAWLYDGGQEYLLIDHDLHVAVRIDGSRRCWRDNDGRLISSYQNKDKAPEMLPGVPERFQPIAFGYIGGPQCFPVGCNQIIAHAPVAKAGYTQEQRDHMNMIVNTGRAAMKLTGHESAQGYAAERSFFSGVDPEMLLKCNTWQDVHENYLRSLYFYGVGRRKLRFDYLLTERP